jgi:signal transduction histidine kinase/integral membrane sensor domain MASE1
MNSTMKTAFTAVLVCLAYLVGAKIGEQLRFLPLTTSVLWPPNAILTATLLLTAPRRWWLYLLAALPAHLIVQLGIGRPTSFVLALFVTNCTEALLAAAGVRRFGDGRGFDTLRGVAIFLIYAVFLAPFLSSFADAAVVSLFNAEPYWLIWRTRFFSNTLTELMLVPAIVMAVTRGWPWIRDAAPSRRLEAALLAVAPLVVGIIAFGPAFDRIAALREPGTQFAFLLPVLLWGAVRFGPGGFSMALLVTTLVAIWAGSQGRGAFSTLPPAQSVLAFQIFLSVIGIPLLCLAAVIEERRRAQAALAERLRFEELLSQLSGSFVHLSASGTDAGFGTWLRELGLFLGVDRLVVYRFRGDSDDVRSVYSWIRSGVAASPVLLTREAFPWMRAQLSAERPIAVGRVEDAPPEASSDVATMRARGARSTLVLPLVAGGEVLGCLALVMFTAERTWPPELVQRLRLVAEVFASALAQKDADEAIRASEALKSAILASLTSGVAVLDHTGRILTVNASWMRFREDRAAWAAHADVGASYLETCRRAAVAGRAHATEAVELVSTVLAGALSTFTLEYSGGEPVASWYTISVVPLPGPDGGAVVAHTETTDVKRAEIDAQRVRQELAHSARVFTMGELTASLAHELNQPLAGIRTNAQAAQRFLDATPPDYSEIRGILSDIVEDNKRAADVIDRLRELMRKGQPESARVDVNDVVCGVIKLVSSDAIIRGVNITSDLASEPLIVLGDRVQLQQVVLNLLVNAMEAMADGAGGQRAVVVRTRLSDRAVEVFVEDNGHGLAAGTHDMLFEPFYTTKSSGMGMGLSIARSIVQAHGGTIWARGNPARGATFHFALPVAGVTVP